MQRLYSPKQAHKSVEIDAGSYEAQRCDGSDRGSCRSAAKTNKRTINMIRYEDGNQPGDEKLTAGQVYQKMRDFENFNTHLKPMSNVLDLPPVKTPKKWSLSQGRDSHCSSRQSQDSMSKYGQYEEDGQTQYFELSDPDADLQRNKETHLQMMECPMYRHQHRLRQKRILEKEAFRKKVMTDNIDSQIETGEVQHKASHVRSSSNEAVRSVQETLNAYRTAQERINSVNRKRIKEVDSQIRQDKKRRLDEERHLGFRREAKEVLEQRRNLRRLEHKEESKKQTINVRKLDMSMHAAIPKVMPLGNDQDSLSPQKNSSPVKKLQRLPTIVRQRAVSARQRREAYDTLKSNTIADYSTNVDTKDGQNTKTRLALPVLKDRNSSFKSACRAASYNVKRPQNVADCESSSSDGLQTEL